MFRHDCLLAVKPVSMPQRLVHKKTWRDSLPIDMLLSAVSVLVVVQLSPEVQEGLMNYPVYTFKMLTKLYPLIKSFNKVHDATVQQHENK